MHSWRRVSSKLIDWLIFCVCALCPEVCLTFCMCFPLFNTTFTLLSLVQIGKDKLHIWADSVNMSLIWPSGIVYFSFDISSVHRCGKCLVTIQVVWMGLFGDCFAFVLGYRISYFKSLYFRRLGSMGARLKFLLYFGIIVLSFLSSGWGRIWAFLWSSKLGPNI